MRFTVAHDDLCLDGHFPGRPLVPGVVVLERVMAAIEAIHGRLRAPRVVQAKFVQPLLPGQEAGITLDGQAPRWRFQVSTGATVLAVGVIEDGGHD